MTMKSNQECEGVSAEMAKTDYFCPDRFHIAKPGAKHAGVYECRDEGNLGDVAKVYVQSKRANPSSFNHL